MKIIGVINGYNNSSEPGKFIVEMNNDEMQIVVKGTSSGYFSGDFRQVNEVEISKKFRHAMCVLQACHEAVKLPSQLKAFADCLETVVPKLEAIAAEEQEELT